MSDWSSVTPGSKLHRQYVLSRVPDCISWSKANQMRDRCERCQTWITNGETIHWRSIQKKRERERNRRGLQWAWDIFARATQAAKQSTKVALEMLGIKVLARLSNLWILMRMGASRDGVSKRLESTRIGRGRNDFRVLWQLYGMNWLLEREIMCCNNRVDLYTQQPATTTTTVTNLCRNRCNRGTGWDEEVKKIPQTLNAAEKRVK